MPKIIINQITMNRIRGVESVKIHFNSDMDINGDNVSTAGNLTDEDFIDFIDVEGLENVIKSRISQRWQNN